MKTSNSTCPSTVVSEAQEKTFNKLNEFAELSENGLAFKFGNISKNYLAGNAYLCVGVVRGDGSLRTQFADYYAFIEAVHPAINNETSDSIFYGEVTYAPKLASIRGWYKFQMLVDVCEVKNGPQVVVPSIVRLLPYHELYKIAVDPRGIFLPAGYEPLKAITSREIDFSNIRFNGTDTGQRNGDLVKRGSKVVDDFGSQDVDQFRRLCGKTNFRSAVASLKVNINEKTWSAILPKTLLNGIEIFSQSICPLDFKRRSIKSSQSSFDP